MTLIPNSDIKTASIASIEVLILVFLVEKEQGLLNLLTGLFFAMPSADTKPRTLYDKVFQDHIVDERDDGTILLYIGQDLLTPVGANPC